MREQQKAIDLVQIITADSEGMLDRRPQLRPDVTRRIPEVASADEGMIARPRQIRSGEHQRSAQTVEVGAMAAK